MDEENGQFYREKTWQLLLEKMESLERKQDAMAADIETIKNQRAWLMGIVAAISFAVSFAWQFLIAKVSSGK